MWPPQVPWTLCPLRVIAEVALLSPRCAQASWQRDLREQVPSLHLRLSGQRTRKTRSEMPAKTNQGERAPALPPESPGVPAREGFSGGLPGGGGRCSLQVEGGAPTPPLQLPPGRVARLEGGPGMQETRIAMRIAMWTRTRLLLFPRPLFIRL